MGLCSGASLRLSSLGVMTFHIEPILLVSFVSLLGSFGSCYLIKRFELLHRGLTFDNHMHLIQKIHHAPVPRVGGLAIMIGLILGLATLLFYSPQLDIGDSSLLLLFLSALPVFLGGIAEDLTKNVRARTRLLLAFISSCLAIYMLHAQLQCLDIFWLDPLIVNTPFMVLFTIFGIGGVTHSFNLIDGLNGLLGGVTLIVMVCFLWLAYQLADYTLLMLVLSVVMPTLGFVLWNWPRARIFAGDGGAYLLGFLTATLLVLLIKRHPLVSPWFPLVLVGYPVIETLFSIYRRRVFHLTALDQPDNNHLHQLIFRIIDHNRIDHPTSLMSNNSLSVIPIWLAVIVVSLITLHFYQDSHVLMCIFLLSIVAYRLCYGVLYFLANHTKFGEVH